MLSNETIQMLRNSASKACSLLKILANDDRFLILCQLTLGEKNVGDLEAALGIQQPTLSQQLAILREENLVQTRREGKFIFYRFSSYEVAEIMKTLSELYCQRAAKPGIKAHSAFFSTTAQIFTDDLRRIAAAGYQTVICVRPDGKVGHPGSKDLRQHAERLNINFIYFPVVTGRITADQVRIFQTLLVPENGRILAYCRTGNCSSNLYRMATSENIAATPQRRYAT